LCENRNRSTRPPRPKLISLMTRTAHAKPEVLKGYLDPRIQVVLRALSALTVLAIAVPACYMLIWSTWGTEVVGRLRSLHEWSLDWIAILLRNPEWRASILRSVMLGVGASFVGAAINAAYNYCRRFSGEYVKNATYYTMIVLLLNPLIAYGMAVRSVGSMLGWSPWLLLYFGHLLVVLPLQYLVFEAGAGAVQDDTLYAARTCGAGHAGTLVHIYLPKMRGAFLTAFVLGFFVSFDEVVIALFVLDKSASTVPVRLWRGLSEVVKPEAAVVSTLLLCTIGFIFMVRHFASGKARFFSISIAERVRRQAVEVAISVGAGILVGVLPLPLGSLEHFVTDLFVVPVMYFALNTVRARSPIWQLIAVANVEKPELAGIPQEFAFSSVESDIEAAEFLRQGRWIDLSSQALRSLVQACFAKCNGPYFGTDRNVPSRFCELYPNYLKTQLERNETVGDVRILFCERAALLADQASNEATVLRFVKDQTAAGVLLLRVGDAIALREANNCHLHSGEFGVFGGRYVLFFHRPEAAEFTASVMLVPVTKLLASHLSDFWRNCILNSEKISASDDKLAFLPLEAQVELTTRFEETLRIK